MRTHRCVTSTAEQLPTSAAEAPAASTAAAPGSYACPNCPKTFGTRIGLGVHRKARHPDLVNAEVDVERTRVGLSYEEMRMAAAEEAYVIRRGQGSNGQEARFLNIHLSRFFPESNRNRVKYTRKTPAYRQLVEQALEALDARDLAASSISSDGTLLPESPAEHPAHAVEGDDASLPGPRELYADAIRRMMGDDSITSHPLISLGQQLLEAHDVTDGVTEWIRSVAEPPGRRRRRPRKRRGRGNVTGSSRQKTRRTEYARMQSMFKANMGKAAKLVIDGELNATTPGLEEMLEFWSPIFEHPSIPVEQYPVLPVGKQRAGLAKPIW